MSSPRKRLQYFKLCSDATVKIALIAWYSRGTDALRDASVTASLSPRGSVCYLQSVFSESISLHRRLGLVPTSSA